MSTCDPRDINPGGGLYGNMGVGINFKNSTWQSPELNLTGSSDFRELMARVAGIEKRLAILRPNWELQARFPALQEAYEHYVVIEKLVNDKTQNLE